MMTRRRAVGLIGLVLLAAGVYVGYQARRADVASATACDDPAFDHVLPELSSRAAFLDVRANETFSVAVPPESRVGLRYEVRSHDTRFAPAGTDAWTDALRDCHGWPEGERPAEVGAYVAERDGQVTISLAPLR